MFVFLPEKRALLAEGFSVLLIGVEGVGLVGLGLFAADHWQVLALAEQHRDELLLLEQSALVRLNLRPAQRVLADEPVVLRLQLLQSLLEPLHLLVIALLQDLQLVRDLAPREVDLLDLLLIGEFVAAVPVEEGLQFCQRLACHIIQ